MESQPPVPRWAAALAFAVAIGGAVAQQPTAREPALALSPCRDAALGDGARCGTYEVFEDRAAAAGRKIALRILVLRATGSDPKPDPVVFLAGGPGQSAVAQARGLARSWMREDRDIVLVDQRGTGGSNPLQIELPGGDDDLQGYLEPIFDVELFRRGRRELEKIADLTKYTTPIAMDDLDEVRAALGYDRINLVGGSYGTRAALVYMRRHPETVRCAILSGVAPIAFRNPLYHAQSAQEALDALLERCESLPRYREAFGDLRAKLREVFARLERHPARAIVTHPRTREKVEVQLTRAGFAEALRVMMYSMRTSCAVPLLILRAHDGDFDAFAESAVRSNRALRDQLAFGMLMCVVGSEDIPRIDPDEIEAATAGTYLGGGRVRAQMAVAAVWPRGDVPDDYGEPVSVDVPVLLFSGEFDAVTPPRWGAEAARHLPNSLHVVVPLAHGFSDPRIAALRKAFLESGSVEGLDLSAVESMTAPPLLIPRR